ncbi:MAG: hypothetical protein CL581_03730 [Alteromonadaceae bacterium]|nr:hypothetical protein [Alteromonadaceae bacterium]|tara:strand:- start:864 stop:1238 length:375 start_codon:yes stop_codon:yes gene_type:complete
MLYPYRCPDCGPFEVSKRMAEASRPEPCPECGAVQADQDIRSKRLGGFVSTEGAWSEGKLVPQLHPNHPDRMVTSKRQMETVYQKHGISLDTGKFVSKQAQIKATVPRQLRTGESPSAVGGVDE